MFGGNIKLPEFDADTVLLLVLVYFLVADDTENISDTLLIIGVLLLQIIFTGLTYLSVDQNLLFIVKGVIILVACAIDMRKYLVRK